MATTITSEGITFNDASTLTSANITLADGSVTNAKLASNAVTVVKLGTTEQTRIAKAWVNFDGTLASPITPRSSYNVNTVTKLANGRYQINFASALADTNYSVSGSASLDGIWGASGTVKAFGSEQQTSQLTTSCVVGCATTATTTAVDATIVSVTIFGN